MFAALIGTLIGFMVMAVIHQPTTPRLAPSRQAELGEAICALIREGVSDPNALALGAVQIVYPEHEWPARTPETEVIFAETRALAREVLRHRQSRCRIEAA